MNNKSELQKVQSEIESKQEKRGSKKRKGRGKLELRIFNEKREEI